MDMPIDRKCNGCGEVYQTGDAIDGTEQCPHCHLPLHGFPFLVASETENEPQPDVHFEGLKRKDFKMDEL